MHRSCLITASAGIVSAVIAGPVAADIIFVNAATVLPAGLQTGASWAFAYKSLQTALVDAVAGDQIWVAAGTYKPTGTADRTISFEMESGVEVLGGFEVGDAFESDRDPVANPTVLSGDIGLPIIGTDNSFHVVRASGVNNQGRLDGFTITRGFANGGGTDNFGGGMRSSGSSLTIADCLFTINDASGSGAALATSGATSPTLIRCTFTDNDSTGSGGAIDCQSTNLRLVASRFSENTCTNSGGAIRFLNGDGAIVSLCTFCGNSAGSAGGAIDSTNSDVTVSMCTFTQNASGGGLGGGAINLGGTASCGLFNSILFADTAPVASELASTVTLSKVGNCIAGAASDGAGNFGADPSFIDALGADGVAGTLDDDLRLAFGSPCTDRGHSGFLIADFGDLDGDGNLAEATSLDLEGTQRFLNDVVPNLGLGPIKFLDVGADEISRDVRIICVDQSATGANNGIDWTDAYTTLSAAFFDANDPKDPGAEVIWVADGTYFPTTTADRSIAIQPPSGVAVFGGFAGGEGSLLQRDVYAHPAIFSGNIGNPLSSADNSFHVVRYSNQFAANDDTILDGFVITGGNANGGAAPIAGGGVVVTNSAKPTIRNCRIIGNSGTDGGGIGTVTGTTPIFVNCLVSGNLATNRGGAFFGSSGGFIGSTIVGNDAHDCGGIFINGGGAGVGSSVLYFNTDDISTGLEKNFKVNGVSLGVTSYSCVQCAGPLDFIPANKNIAANPRLADPDGPDDVFGTLDDNGELLPGSPCIDAANNFTFPGDHGDMDEDGVGGTQPNFEAVPFDLTLSKRVLNDAGMPDVGNPTPGPTADMGCVEFEGTTAGPLPVVSDINGDGGVDGADLGILLGHFFTEGPQGDLDFSCFVDGADLGILLGAWTG